MPELGTIVRPPSRAAWRAWLTANHKTTSDAWLRLVKKAHIKPNDNLSYIEAVEEALCFGWIDSTCKRLDETALAQRFLPRKNLGNWSEINQQRVRHLHGQKLMTEAGWAAMPAELAAALKTTKPLEAPEIPTDMMTALKRAKALDSFRAFPISYQRIRVAHLSTPGTVNAPGERTKRIAALVKAALAGKMRGVQANEIVAKPSTNSKKEKTKVTSSATKKSPSKPSAKKLTVGKKQKASASAKMSKAA